MSGTRKVFWRIREAIIKGEKYFGGLDISLEYMKTLLHAPCTGRNITMHWLKYKKQKTYIYIYMYTWVMSPKGLPRIRIKYLWPESVRKTRKCSKINLWKTVPQLGS